MTNDDVLANLQPGCRLRSVYNGRETIRDVLAIKARGTCTYDKARAFGHAYALVVCWQSENATITFAVHSDEYSKADGYPTHDATGARILGHDLLPPTPESLERLAYAVKHLPSHLEPM